MSSRARSRVCLSGSFFCGSTRRNGYLVPSGGLIKPRQVVGAVVLGLLLHARGLEQTTCLVLTGAPASGHHVATRVTHRNLPLEGRQVKVLADVTSAKPVVISLGPSSAGATFHACPGRSGGRSKTISTIRCRCRPFKPVKHQ